MMRLIKDAIALTQGSKSVLVLLVVIANFTLIRLGSKVRVRRFPVKRFNLHGATYFANSWDGLLVLRPGHEPDVHRELTEIARSKGRGGTFVNVGAHIGRYCFEFADSFATTYAFEPTKSTFSLLQAGSSAHPNRSSIRLIMKGIAESRGYCQLNINPDESQNSITTYEGNALEGSQEVSMSTIDDELPEEDQRMLRLLVIDVEGAEKAVLLGARQTLSRSSPTIIIELLTSEAISSCTSLLDSMGFDGVPIDGSNWKFCRRAESQG